MERCPVGFSCAAPFSPGFSRGLPFIGCPDRRPVHPFGGIFPSIFWCFWCCGPFVSTFFFAPSREGSQDLWNCPCRSPTGIVCVGPFRSPRACCCSSSFFFRRRRLPRWERGFSGEGRCDLGSEKGEPVFRDRGLSTEGKGSAVICALSVSPHPLSVEVLLLDTGDALGRALRSKHSEGPGNLSGENQGVFHRFEMNVEQAGIIK
jgi:hypothetical protein